MTTGKSRSNTANNDEDDGYVMRRSDEEERDERIANRIIVDAYTPDEQAIGWHTYLEETMDFPFETRCIDELEVSPLEEGETVRVVGKALSKPTLRQQIVMIEWMGSELGVPLAQLEPIDASDETEQAVADWHYWLGRS